MHHTPYQGSDGYLWDVQNRRRLGRYLTDTVSGFIARYLPQGDGRVLDIACGTGKLSQLIDSHGFGRVSLEFDFEPLRWFRRRDAQALLVNADAQALPFAAQTFDHVIAVEMIDYVPDHGRFYAEMLRVLKPGGRLMMTYTNRRSIKGLVYGTYLRAVGRPRIRQYYQYSLDQSVAELRAAGFTVLGQHGYNWNVLPRDADNVLVDVCAGIEKLCGLEHLPRWSPLVFVVGEKPRA